MKQKRERERERDKDVRRRKRSNSGVCATIQSYMTQNCILICWKVKQKSNAT
jgi:hypothetical protein